VPLGEAEQVVVDKHLAVGVPACADADRGDGETLRDLRCDRGRDGLEDDGEGAGLLERERVVDELPRRLGGLPLRLEPTEHRR